MRILLALAGKDIRLLLRDKAGFFFVFFFPLLSGTFMGVIFSGGGHSSKGIPIALVDEDSTQGSQKFAAELQGKAELDIFQTTRAEAKTLVQRGKKSAYVILKPGFGEAWDRLFWGDPATIEMGLDPARQAEAGMLEGILTRYFMEGMQEVFTNPQRGHDNIRKALGALQEGPENSQEPWPSLRRSLTDFDRYLLQVDSLQATSDSIKGTDTSQAAAATSNGWQPLKIEVSDVSVQREGPKNSFEITFPQAIVWGLLGCAAAFGISLVVERTRGTLLRLRTAPLARWQILAGKALACFITTLTVTTVLIIVGATIFHVRPHSLPLLGLAVVSASLCFVGIMMLLSVLGRTEASAGGIGWAVLLIASMIGGGMVPLFFMPSWMQSLGAISPVRWAILALEGAIWRGFALDVMMGHCAILVGIGAACFLVEIKVFSWSD